MEATTVCLTAQGEEKIPADRFGSFWAAAQQVNMDFVTAIEIKGVFFTKGFAPEGTKPPHRHRNAHAARALDADVNRAWQGRATFRRVDRVNIVLARCTAPIPKPFQKLREFGGGDGGNG